jgi:hypothetical protein
MAGKLTLTIPTVGPKQGQTFVFEEHDTLLLGRMSDCHVWLPDDQRISRHHFLLEVNPPLACIRDLGSRNGSYVNGQKYGGRARDETPEEGLRRQYPQVELHDGDQIRVGDTTLRLNVEAHIEPAKPARCLRCGKEIPPAGRAPEDCNPMCEQCQTRAQVHVAVPLIIPHQDQQDMPGRGINVQISDYQSEQELGRGRMGVVYLVRARTHSQRAALKVMRSKIAVSDHARRQFLREIEATSRLRHPHIVEFLGSGTEGNTFYFLVEYCARGSLAQFMRQRGGPLTWEAKPLLLQALEGLEYIHERGFVHRDLKPQNILLTESGRSLMAKVADFVLPKMFTQAGFSGLTITGDKSGTLPFMPREQLINFKYCKPASDVWVMGATCYYVLTGVYPRDQRGQDPLIVVLEEEAVPIRKRNTLLPVALAEVIDRSLQADENARYQHAGDMLAALRNVL